MNEKQLVHLLLQQSLSKSFSETSFCVPSNHCWTRARQLLGTCVCWAWFILVSFFFSSLRTGEVGFRPWGIPAQIPVLALCLDFSGVQSWACGCNAEAHGWVHRHRNFGYCSHPVGSGVCRAWGLWAFHFPVNLLPADGTLASSLGVLCPSRGHPRSL